MKGIRMTPWYDLGSRWRYAPGGGLYRYRVVYESLGPSAVIATPVLQRRLTFTLRRKSGRPRVGRN